MSNPLQNGGELPTLRARSQRLAESKDWGPAALATNRDLLALDPADTRARNRLARCFLQKGDVTSAQAEYEGVLRQDPQNQVARQSLDRIRGTTTTPVTRKRPRSSDTAEKLRARELETERFRLETQQKKDAAAAARRKRGDAIARIDDFAKAFQLGKAAKEQGDLTTAIAAYKRALELRPGDPGTAIALAAVYRRGGMFTAARRLLSEAMQVSRSQAAIVTLAAVARAEAQFEEAIELYQEVLDENPRDAFALNGLGGVYFDLEDYASAEACFLRARASEIGKKEAGVGLRALLEVYRNSGDFRAASRIQEQLGGEAPV